MQEMKICKICKKPLTQKMLTIKKRRNGVKLARKTWYCPNKECILCGKPQD